MRSVLSPVLLSILCLSGCGTDPTAAPPAVPDAPASVEQSPGAQQHEMGLNTEVHVDQTVLDRWAGAVVEVASSDGKPERTDLPIGEPVPLGDTGLTATALLFIPAFTMGDDGISSRSAEPENPALRIRVTEAGEPDFEGWLFAAMPEIHPFPHETVSIVLIGGIAAE